jgi:hypothetical protein
VEHKPPPPVTDDQLLANARSLVEALRGEEAAIKERMVRAQADIQTMQAELRANQRMQARLVGTAQKRPYTRRVQTLAEQAERDRAAREIADAADLPEGTANAAA